MGKISKDSINVSGKKSGRELENLLKINLNDDLAIATEKIAEEEKGAPEDHKVNKLQKLLDSDASHQQIRRALVLSAQIVGQLFNTRVSKHNNKKRTTTKAVRKKKRKAQKRARKRNRNNIKSGARTTKSSTSTRHRSKT